MRGQDPHGNRDFREALLTRPSARELWHAQHHLDSSSAWRAGAAQQRAFEKHRATLADWVVEAQMAPGGRVFRVAAGAVAPLQRRIGSLDRRASRLGMAPIRLRDTGERDPDGYVFIVLSGRAPALPGWALAAIVEHRDGQATLRPVAELGERLDRGAFATPRCEHCRLRRLRTWARELLPTRSELSQFERDALAVLTGGPVLTGRERGLVCALIAVYRQRRGQSRHLARPGARLETTVVVERVTAQASRRHGTVYRCELVDANANRLVWWQTRGEPLRAGEVVTLAGRVHRHTRFGKTPVTVLSHCRRRRAMSFFAG